MMSEIPVPEFVQNLTDDELRKELAKNGEKVGPITPTTRNLYKKRLLRKLNPSLENIETSTENKENVKETHENSDKTTQTIQNDTSNKVANSTATQTEGIASTPTKRSPRKQCHPRKLQNASLPNFISLGTNQLHDKNIVTSESEDGEIQSTKLYYGICLATVNFKPDETEPIVFENKMTAIAMLKKHKNARFKEFDSFEKAKNFSLNAREMSDIKTSSSTAESNDTSNKFRSLKQEDLNKLTRCIEKGDLPKMLGLVWQNPKYLISSADGPVTLKPNARYNALHIAAKSNEAEICREILQLLHNREFQSLLFSNMDDENVWKHRTEHLVDAYLNTPDKILFETPLHFASKAGFKDVVRELVTYENCSTSMLNKAHQTAIDVVCSRASGIMTNNKAEIELLITKRYYVPLLRCHGNSENAIVGEPIKSKFEYSDSSSPLRSNLSIRAFAGPMMKTDAEEFRKKWVTPSKQKNLAKKFRYVRRYDCEKGDEQIGRELASKSEIGWSEFWDFMDDFANFSTEDGLQKLEKYLQEKSCRSHSDTALQIDKLADMLQEVHFSPRQQNDSIEHELFVSKQADSNEGHEISARNSLIKSPKFNPTLAEIELQGNTLMPKKQGDQTQPLVCQTDCTETSSHSLNEAVAQYEVTSVEQLDTTAPPLLSTTEKLGCPESANPQNLDLATPSTLTNSNPAPSLSTIADNFFAEKENPNIEPTTQNKNSSSGSGDVSNLNNKNDMVVEPNIFRKTSLENEDKSETDCVRKPSETMSVDNLYFVDNYRCATSSETESELFSSPSCSTISDASYPLSHIPQVFLTGLRPTKRDQDVVTAIGNAGVNPEKFPATFRWRTAVLSFSENVRLRWSTPRKLPYHHSQSVCDVPVLSEALFTCSPLPSSGVTHHTFATPPRDFRRLLFKTVTPPWTVSKQP